MVRRSANDMRGRRKPEDRYIPARVTKVGRVWAELTEEKPPGVRPRPRVWRMRMDRSQDEGSQYSGSNASFATMDQHAWDETAYWALAVLQENGIDIRHGSPWRGREIELADIISKGITNREDNGS